MNDVFGGLVRDARRAAQAAALRDAAGLLTAADAGDDDACNAIWRRCEEGTLAAVLVQECIRLARKAHGADGIDGWVQSIRDRAEQLEPAVADVIPLRPS